MVTKSAVIYPVCLCDLGLGGGRAGCAGHIGIGTRSIAGEVDRISESLPVCCCMLAVLIPRTIAALHKRLGDQLRASHLTLCAHAMNVSSAEILPEYRNCLDKHQ